MSDKRDYTSYSFFVAILVIAIMLLVNFIPSFRVGGLNFKRTNIISDIIKQADTATLLEADLYMDTTFLAEMPNASEIETSESADKIPTATTTNWEIDSSLSSKAHLEKPSSKEIKQAGDMARQSKVTEIEDFSPSGGYLNNFYAALARHDKGRPTRIAVLGDSFIEGDIITADIREQLQTIYTGRGVGFVPLASPTSRYRGTVKHTFSNWEVYNLIQKRSAPDDLKDKFFVSGVVCVPEEGAKAHFEGVNFRKHIKKCSLARLLFINRGGSVINVVVNDSLHRVFTPESSNYVQQIVINADIAKLDVSIDRPEGFIGYGVVFEESAGVTVDNYSIRGNSGAALFGTDGSVNRQINKILQYDMIVLQYGLNVMTPDVSNYNLYSAQLEKIIDYVKRCFPQSAIVVMSVGDRSTQREGEFVTMPTVYHMVEAQRNAAKNRGIAFWNTFEAMGGENSMVGFVRRNWAAKDYTHIGYAGGKYIGCEFVKSMVKRITPAAEEDVSEFSLPSYKLNITTPEK